MDALRRDFLLRGLCACSLWGLTQHARAKELPTNLTPLVGPDYRPTDADERGLWQQCERLEQELAASKLRLQDEALDGYVRGVLERLLGTQAVAIRVYVMRDPDFNAAMTPNGAMIVQTGLLVRMRSEAQFAAVIGHECGHYLRRHTVQNFRALKSKTAAMSVLLVLGGIAAGGLGIGLASGLNAGLALSLFSFSRELEAEADAYGLQLLTAAGYPPEAAAEVWTQIIGERKASAGDRKKKYRDKALSAMSTHPPSEERLRDLSDTAAVLERKIPSMERSERHEEWRAAMAPQRSMLLEEQVKLNDPGANLYLINALAQDGWDGELRYYEGEVYRLRAEENDDVLASGAYAAAVATANPPAEAFRAHGYALLRAGRPEEGRRSLTRYLELAPQAPDAEMVRDSLQQ